MEDREQRRRARREAAISENITKRSQGFWIPATAGEASGEAAAAAATGVDDVDSGPQAEEPHKTSEAAATLGDSAFVTTEPAAAAEGASSAKAQREPRTRSSEETMVFVIKTNAIRDKKKGGESDE